MKKKGWRREEGDKEEDDEGEGAEEELNEKGMMDLGRRRRSSSRMC